MRQEHRLRAETIAIRGRGWIRNAVRLVGLVAVLLGAFNGIFVPALGANAVFPMYRVLLPGSGFVSTGSQALAGPAVTLYLADYALMGVGAVLGWFA